jgi:uridine kinase
MNPRTVNLGDLLSGIKSAHKDHQTLIIGIDGYGGSGKSTIAKFLKENLSGAVIVEMDDFYSPELKRADYARVNEQVLELLVNDLSASYQIYDWKLDSLTEFKKIDPGGIVIIEGVYSTHKDFADKYDVKIWVNCPQEVGAKRGIERDKMMYGVDNTDKWVHMWMPEEKKYVESQNPQQYADYIIEGDGLIV